MTAVKDSMVFLLKASLINTVKLLVVWRVKKYSVCSPEETRKYVDFKTDLAKAGWTTNLVPFKGGARGQFTKNNDTTTRDIIKLVKNHTKQKKLITELFGLILHLPILLSTFLGIP